jgi:uncharacterized protein YbjT (DUF2867 family)
MTILITGATGDVGSKVGQNLIRRDVRPRVFVRNAAKARSLFGDRCDIIVGDLAHSRQLRSAMEGVDQLFLVNSGPQIPVRDAAVAIAAKAAGVKHLVKLSSMDVRQGLAIGAWHEQGEAAIRACGIPFTFVQPSGFMTNLLAWAHAVKTEGIVRSSTGDGRRAFIHSDDIAAVVTEVLTTDECRGESLAITGPAARSFAEVTATIGSVIGRSLSYQPISDEEARQRYSIVSTCEEETEAHVALWRAIREGRLATVTNEVERMLSRRPFSLDQCAAENSVAFR